MTNTGKATLISICLLGVAIQANPVQANDKALPKEERLLRYQEVFHHFYRKDELNALVSLQSGFGNNTISSRVDSNKLLLGALYNSYGISHIGQPILENIATQTRQKNVKDLAWFYLSKQNYEDENFRALPRSLSKISPNLPALEQEQRQYILGMYYLKTRDFKKAENILAKLDKKTNSYYFLMFNLGSGYLQTNRVKQGVKYISKVGDLKLPDETMLSLKDKANVVLGYQYLTSNQSELAIQHFEKVRLEGAFSLKALLGLGWAYSQLEQHRQALVPWLMLAKQDISNIEVQESLMAVPYTYRVMESQRKAVELYENSINAYENLKQKIDDAIGFVESASLFKMLFVNEQYDDYAISNQLRTNLETDLGRMLFELLKEEEIQIMLDEYRDLLQLQSEMKNWQGKLDKMNQVIGATENAEDLPDLLHGDSDIGFSNLPSKVAKKIQYKERLLTLNNRVALQNDRLNILLDRYEQEIRTKVLEELEERNQFVVTYLSQTRYSLAELLDKSQESN